MEFAFIPEARQGACLDARMRRLLADSLQHIDEQASAQLAADFSALRRVVAGLRQLERLGPGVFGLYTDLVLAIQQDDLELARALIEAFAAEQPAPMPWRLVSLDAPVIARHRARYISFMGAQPDTAFDVMAPPPLAAAQFAQRLELAVRRLERAAPGLLAEMRSLVSEIVMVQPMPGATQVFDGGSCYMLWGAMFLNIDSHDGEVALIEALAHESAHLLLYACAADEALTLNPDHLRYPSPLRTDPRPMDGIVHATFVSARMHWAMSALMERGGLDPSMQMQAEQAREADAVNFFAGDEIIRAHAQLSPSGARVMDAARRYMADAAS